MIAIRSADLVEALRGACPTEESPKLIMEFQQLWSVHVDRPWYSGQENVLGLYALNQEVAQTASGREGERYSRTALANMARLKARWTEIPDDQEWKALEKDAPEEVPWLEIMINRRCAPEAQRAIEAWSPPAEPWLSLKRSLAGLFPTGKKKLQSLPVAALDELSPGREVLHTAYDMGIELLGTTLSERGAWKRVSTALQGVEGLYPHCYRVGASLYAGKLKKGERDAAELELSDLVYYLRRLEKRFAIRGWQRALGLQKKIIELVTGKSRFKA